MFKHQEIIDKLTIQQKLSLLADASSLGSEENVDKELPLIKEATMYAMNDGSDGEEVYPSFHALANSWDSDLVGRVAEELSARARRKGVNLLNVPNANVKSSPYADGLSEDPYIVGEMVAACVSAGARVNVKTCVEVPALRKEDVEVSDLTLNERALHEYFQRPFYAAVKAGVGAVEGALPELKGEYANVNGEWLDSLKERLPVLYECRSAQETLEYVRAGDKLCRKGNLHILQEGYERYKKLREGFEAGAISLSELEAECNSGNALSPDMIDSALDTVLEFATDCNRLKNQAASRGAGVPNLALAAAEESIVLLKNEKALPLKHGAKIALIGDPSTVAGTGVKALYKHASELFAMGQIQYVGCARGYDIGKDRSDALMEEAKELAQRADTVVVLLGCDEHGRLRAQRNRTCRLPANQLALLEELKKRKVKIVAVVCGENYPDMSFDTLCDGLLLAPVGSSASAQALFRVLRGESSPSGRLAASCYGDTDEYFETLRRYKDAGRNKVGTFYGYRHYDTSAQEVKYPFGYGLCYTKFTYQKVQYTTWGIRVRVKNTGRVAGSEVIQLYIGKKDSALIRPKKELKAFRKVYLYPGDSKDVEFEWKDLDCGVWDEKSEKWVNEGGRYEFYVGSSVKDVRLKGTFSLLGETLEKNDEKLSDYIQTCSNIKSRGYYLDLPAKLPKENEKRRKTAIVFSVLLLCFDIIYGYFHFTGWAPRGNLHLGGLGIPLNIPMGGIVYTLLFIINALPFGFAIGLTVRKKYRIKKCVENSMKQKQKEREELNVDELAEELPYEQLFEEEFAERPHELTEEKTETVREREERTREVVPFDKEFTLSVACEQFATFVNERGVLADAASVKKLFAALSASRLLVLKSNNDELLGKLISLMGEYFGAETVVSVCGQSFTPEDGLLYVKLANGEVVPSAFARSVIRADAADARIHLTAIEGAKSGILKEYLAPVVRYLDNPERETHITVKNGEKTEAYAMPDTVWFIVTLTAGERITAVPKYILEMASVVDLFLQPGVAIKTRPVVQTVSNGEPVSKPEEVETVEPEESPMVEAEETVAEEITAEETADILPVEEEEFLHFEAEVIPASVPEAAMQVVEEVVETKKTPVKKLEYEQFKKMVENACREYQLEEVQWKRVDKLEEYVNACNEYRIENKLWQRMEKYVAVYLASGGESEEALDGVLATHLIYGMLPCIAESKKPLEEKLPNVLESIFGEGHVAQTLKAVKEEGLGV